MGRCLSYTSCRSTSTKAICRRIAELINRQEGLDRAKLTPIAKQYLVEVPWEILDDMGHPADVIVSVAQGLPADLIVMVTHGRRGLARLVEGSIAEKPAATYSVSGPRCSSRPLTSLRTPAHPTARGKIRAPDGDLQRDQAGWLFPSGASPDLM